MDEGKRPGREKWVASFVTRVGEGDTKFLQAGPPTWGNPKPKLEKQEFGAHGEMHGTKFPRRQAATWGNTKPNLETLYVKWL